MHKNIFDEFWSFDFGTNEFSLIKSSTKIKPVPSAFSNCQLERDDTNVFFWKLSGKTYANQSLGDAYRFDF